MKLWTIQPLERYKELLEKKEIFSTIEYETEEYFRRAYDWLIGEMEIRISPKPFLNSSPIWAWYQYSSVNKRKPDMREVRAGRWGVDEVRIEFEKDEREVPLFDFDLWHLPLNNGNICDNEKEDAAFDKIFFKKGGVYTEPSTYTPEIQEMIMEHWDKVFDMSYCPKYSARPFEQKRVQATFWSLKLDEVLKVDIFKARKAKK